MSKSILSEATDTFVAGWTAIKRLTGPFEMKRLGKARLAFDPTGRRRGELIATGLSAAELARELPRVEGHVAVSAIYPEGGDLEARKKSFRALAWRLLATEGLFVHDLKHLPPADPRVRRARGAADVARVAKLLRRRPSSLGIEDIDDAPIRLYEANIGGRTVGWVKSVGTGSDGWVADLKVLEPHRRKGFGRALMAALLADDLRFGRHRSVLLASHAGAMLYPLLGYRRIGTLMLLMPKKT